MANIFTRKALNEIMDNEELTPQQRTEQVFALYGRALDDGYIAKAAAQQAQQTALENARAAWLKASISRQAVSAGGENHPVNSEGLDGVTRADREKGVKVPDPKESDDYKALLGQFEAYKAMQTARASEDFKGVKAKFFEQVYGMVDRGDGAKPVKEQLDGIRKQYEEYFDPAEPVGSKPTFGAPVEGSMPKGDRGAVAGFTSAWGFVPRR